MQGNNNNSSADIQPTLQYPQSPVNCDTNVGKKENSFLNCKHEPGVNEFSEQCPSNSPLIQANAQREHSNFEATQQAMRKKGMVARLPIGRFYAAYRRRLKKLSGNIRLGIMQSQIKDLVEILEDELSKYQVPQFDSTKVLGSAKGKVDTSRRDTKIQMSSQHHKDERLRTPSPNEKTRNVLRKRLEETPLKKSIMGVPSYVYNSDDEILL